MIELVCFCTKDIRRPQNVRQMIVESQVIVDNAVINVVRFQEVLQRPRPLLRLALDLVSFDFGQLDAAGAARPAAEVGQGRPSDLEHFGYQEDLSHRLIVMMLSQGAVAAL